VESSGRCGLEKREETVTHTKIRHIVCVCLKLEVQCHIVKSPCTYTEKSRSSHLLENSSKIKCVIDIKAANDAITNFKVNRNNKLAVECVRWERPFEDYQYARNGTPLEEDRKKGFVMKHVYTDTRIPSTSTMNYCNLNTSTQQHKYCASEKLLLTNRKIVSLLLEFSTP
jgi:hypothetical protein